MQTIETLWRDARYAWRALRKTPAFAAGALLTVALTVGAATSIYSVVHGVLLRDLPIRDSSRVYWVWSDQPGRDRTPFNVPDFLDYRRSATRLDGFAGFFSYGANLSDEAAAERIQGLRVTDDFFAVLGSRAGVGRVLQTGDAAPGSDHVVVLTDSFWRRRFGSDPSIIGRTIRLNTESFTVVSVLEPGFVTPIPGVEFAVPYSPETDPRRGARNSLNFIIGLTRLADGATPAVALEECNGIASRLQQQFPVENARKRGVKMIGAIDGIAGAFRASLLTLLAAVAAVLLIACANLANLMLTRASSRRGEIAVQLAIGASRGAIVREVTIEALLIAMLGGTLGTLLAWWATGALVALAPSALPRASDISIDATVLLFSLAVSALAGLIFGIFPALASARVEVRDALLDGGRASTSGGRRLRGMLVSSEVALAVALLIVMAMLTSSFANVQSVSPGFDPSDVLSARLTLPARHFTNRDSIVTFQRQLEDRMTQAAGVTRTAAITLVPLSGLLARVPFTVEGQPIERERVPFAQFRTVTPGYFAAARIPLKRGRSFTAQDTADTPAVAVINESLAARWLPNVNPIRARLMVDDNDGAPRPVEIVGVAGDVKQITLDGEPTFDVYLTYAQIHPDNLAAATNNMFWLTRVAGGDPMRVAETLRSAVRSLDPEIAASQIRPLGDYLTEGIAPRRFSVELMVTFGAAALLLALVGIYAIVSYATLQRGREIAIRAALGATPQRIARLVIGQGLGHVTIGIGLGIVLAAGVTRLLGAMLFGVAATDLSTFAVVTLLVGAASLVACGLPALTFLTAAGWRWRLPRPSWRRRSARTA